VGKLDPVMAGVRVLALPDVPARLADSHMLPPFIIEQIRRRETEERERRAIRQPRLELPVDHVRPATEADDDPDAGRGVVVIEL